MYNQEIYEFFDKNQKKILKIKEKLKKKKVIIYGTGKFFQYLLEKNIFENWDILGICDRKYSIEEEGNIDFSFKIIPFQKLSSYKPDYILISAVEHKNILKNIKALNLKTKVLFFKKESIFENTKELLNKQIWFNKIKYRKTNTFVYIKSNGKRILNPKIKNLKIEINGKNNYIEIHEPIKIEKEVKIFCNNDNRLIIKGNNIFQQMKINLGNNSELEIGEYTTVRGTSIYMHNNPNTKIKIGNDCMLSYNIMLRTSDAHAIYDINTKKQINIPADIEISDHVWIGTKVIILKGTKIPANSVIGANSLINKSFSEENCIIAGTPAKVIKNNINWVRSATL